MTSPDDPFPVTYSLLSPPALVSDVRAHYPIEEPTDVRLYVGVNDTYTLRTPTGTYILRVYRTGWRSYANLQYELDLLAYLDRADVPVAMAIPQHDGSLIRTLPAPEGPRQAVLFTYVDGVEPSETAEHSHMLGSALGQIHNAAATFHSPHARTAIDFSYLLDQPPHALRPVLAHRPADRTYLVRLADDLRARVEALPSTELSWGVCHGDFQRKNTRLNTDGTITTFDFDHCGLGWRAYDLAVFCPTSSEPAQQASWQAFLDGYGTQRRLSDADYTAIPWFVAMIRIHSMGFFAAHRFNSLWGSDVINDRYFDHEIDFLRRWMATNDS